MENQLKEIRQIKHQNYTNSKYPPKEQSTKSSEEKHPIDNVTHKWSKNATLIFGDSMITGVDETMISRKDSIVKVRSISGTTIDYMYDYLKPILKKLKGRYQTVKLAYQILLKEQTIMGQRKQWTKLMNFCLLYNLILSITITLRKAN